MTVSPVTMHRATVEKEELAAIENQILEDLPTNIRRQLEAAPNPKQPRLTARLHIQDRNLREPNFTFTLGVTEWINTSTENRAVRNDQIQALMNDRLGPLLAISLGYHNLRWFLIPEGPSQKRSRWAHGHGWIRATNEDQPLPVPPTLVTTRTTIRLQTQQHEDENSSLAPALFTLPALAETMKEILSRSLGLKPQQIRFQIHHTRPKDGDGQPTYAATEHQVKDRWVHYAVKAYRSHEELLVNLRHGYVRLWTSPFWRVHLREEPERLTLNKEECLGVLSHQLGLKRTNWNLVRNAWHRLLVVSVKDKNLHIRSRSELR